MVNGKTPVYLTLAAFALMGAMVFLIQPYSADFPRSEYAKPARHYLRAAMRQDSEDLKAIAASPAAVDWALQVARTHPDSLAAWGARTYTYVTGRRGDTSEVLVYPAVDPCSKEPIVKGFIGSGSHAKVVQAHSACLPTTR